MRRNTRLGLAALVLAAGLAGLAGAPGAAAEEAVKRDPVKIGLTSTLFREIPPPVVQTIMRPFKSLMESQTGLGGELVPGIPPEALGAQLKDEKIQLAVFHGFEFAWARQKDGNLRPLMIAVNQHAHLRAHLLVRDDCDAAAWADLKGKTLALPRRTREHCHLFLDRRCEKAGEPAGRYFKVVTPASAEDGLDAVVNGKAHAVVADGTFLQWYRERKPDRFARLKTLEQSEVFPAGVIAYYADSLDETTLRRFREGMIGAKDNPRGQQLMGLCQITSFEPIPDDYDRLLTAIAKAYPPAKEK
jgi:ABC-type phosphate/phosphonate transport system substrate-binding protein